MSCAGSSTQTPDDYATNKGYTSTEASAQASDSKQTEISKDDMKVGVIYISDPSEGSGYSYTHDLGIQGMQENLGLHSDQIERKIVDDGDAAATEISKILRKTFGIPPICSHKISAISRCKVNGR